MHAWILVADSSRARLFSAKTAVAPLQEERSFEHPESRAKRDDLITGGRGRQRDTGPGHRSAMEQMTDPKDHEAEVFARELVQALESARAEHTFQRLYLVAPPHFLGVLRPMLGGPLSDLVQDEVDKNLVHAKPDKIREALPYRI